MKLFLKQILVKNRNVTFYFKRLSVNMELMKVLNAQEKAPFQVNLEKQRLK
jgi:hypothetical protein